MDYDKLAAQFGGQVVGGQRASKVGNIAIEANAAKEEAGKSVTSRFFSALPGAISDMFIKNPAKLAVSGAMAPVDIGRQITGMKPIVTELPFVGKTFQAEAQSRLDKGQNPLLAVGQSALEVPLAGLETIGVGKALAAAPRLLQTATQNVTRRFGQKLADRAEKKSLDYALELTAPKITSNNSICCFGNYLTKGSHGSATVTQ